MECLDGGVVCLDGGMVGGLDGDDDGEMMCIFHTHTHTHTHINNRKSYFIQIDPA